jgi:protein-disulfide isomerase
LASRKEQKEQARAAREAAQREATRADQRARRMKLLGGGVGVAVIIVVVAIAVSSGGGSKGSSSNLVKAGSEATSLVKAVDQELAGAPQSGMRLGRASAPVQMTYFGDLQCPVCRDFSLQILPDVIANYVANGKMSIVYRSLETASPDPSVFHTQQVAAYAAGRQDKAWQFVELFYHQQGDEGTAYVDEAYLTGIARQIKGLDVKRWQADRKIAKLSDQVSADASAASAAGASATPTLVLKGPKGTQTLPSYSLDDIKSGYDAVA